MRPQEEEVNLRALQLTGKDGRRDVRLCRGCCDYAPSCGRLLASLTPQLFPCKATAPQLLLPGPPASCSTNKEQHTCWSLPGLAQQQRDAAYWLPTDALPSDLHKLRITCRARSSCVCSALASVLPFAEPRRYTYTVK